MTIDNLLFKLIGLSDGLWKSSEVQPDENKLILLYNEDSDDYDLIWGSCPRDYKWLYVEELFSTIMVESLHKYEHELDEMI